MQIMTNPPQPPPGPPALPGHVEPEGLFTSLGPLVRELDPEQADKISRILADGMKRTEDQMLKILEQAGRYLVLVNAGGITVCVGVVTALVAVDKPIFAMMPAALLFVGGLALCGARVLNLGSYLLSETQLMFKDLGRIARSEVPIDGPMYKTQFRREKAAQRKKAPLFVISFWCFIAGAFATVLGLAWPALVSLFITTP